jgi:hypothetical protein
VCSTRKSVNGNLGLTLLCLYTISVPKVFSTKMLETLSNKQTNIAPKTIARAVLKEQKLLFQTSAGHGRTNGNPRVMGDDEGKEIYHALTRQEQSTGRQL